MNSSNSSRLRRSGSAAKGGGTTVFIVDANGGCSPATADAMVSAFKSERTDKTIARSDWRKKKAAELQSAREDRAAARHVRDELEKEARVQLLPRVRIRVLPSKVPFDEPAPRRAAPSKADSSSAPQASSWLVDPQGMKGVQYSQNYIGRKSEGFYVGCARDAFDYAVRDEAVLLDEDGRPLVITNLGLTIDEIAAAWDVIEQATTRANGKILTRIILPLDADAPLREQIDGLRRFVGIFEALGLGYTAVLHDAPSEGDERNRHAHILVHFREVERVAPYEWTIGREVRAEFDGKEGIATGRSLWAHAMTEAAEANGRNIAYTGLSYANRGMNEQPGKHLGPALTAVLRHGGRVAQAERNAFIQVQNDNRRKIRDAEAKIAALKRIQAGMLEKEGRPAAWLSGPRQNAQRPAYRPQSAAVNKAPPRFRTAKLAVCAEAPFAAYAAPVGKILAHGLARWMSKGTLSNPPPDRWKAPEASTGSSQPSSYRSAESGAATRAMARYAGGTTSLPHPSEWTSGRIERFVTHAFDTSLSLEIAAIEREASELEKRRAREAEAARAATALKPTPPPDFGSISADDMASVFREANEAKARKRASDLAIARRLFGQVLDNTVTDEQLLDTLSEANHRRAIMQPLLAAAWNEADDNHLRASAKAILDTSTREQLRELSPVLRQTVKHWCGPLGSLGHQREGVSR